MTEEESGTPHWLFGDQLGPHFVDPARGGSHRDAPLVMIESRGVFRRRRFHRAKAHLILSAMRHRHAELGERCRYVKAATYRAGLAEVDEALSVVQPTSWSALRFVDRIATERELERLPARGFATSRSDFTIWADGRGRRRLLLEDFYRDARRRLDVLMQGSEPAAGAWNYDADNRFRGQVREFALYNRALSSAEVLASSGNTTVLADVTLTGDVLKTAPIVDQATRTVTLPVKPGTDRSKLTPTYSTAAGVTASPASGTVRDLRTPFGGVKASGLGQEGGYRSIDFYTDQQAVHINLGEVHNPVFGKQD